jgi:hypothetical protein
MDAGPNDGRETVVELAVTPNRDLDLLFVVDDSPSMLDKQTNLVNNFPLFVERLNRAPGGLPNLHLGVVTTDMGTLSSGSATPGPGIGQVGNGGCSGTGKGGRLQVGTAPVTSGSVFISDVKQTDGTRLKNYTGDLATAFAMMARPGAGGCGFEQPLAAMKAALGPNPANVGFLRPNALLGVVFVTDEDDCSAKSTTLFSPESPAVGPLQSFRCTRFGVTCATGGATSDAMNQAGTKAQCSASVGSTLLDDVAPYRDFLKGLKGDPKMVVVSGIMPPPEPVTVELRAPPGGGTPTPALAHSCTYQGFQGLEVGDPAVRMKTLLDGFPDRSTFSTLCQVDLSGGLALIGELVGRVIGTPCVNADLADADPGMPGLQADCVVEDVVGTNVTKISQCGANEQPPCWKLETDAAACMGPRNLKLTVVRAGAPNPATVTRMRCVVAK